MPQMAFSTYSLRSLEKWETHFFVYTINYRYQLLFIRISFKW